MNRTNRSKTYAITWDHSQGSTPTDRGTTVHEIARVLLDEMTTLLSEGSTLPNLKDAAAAMEMVADLLKGSDVGDDTLALLEDPFNDPLA